MAIFSQLHLRFCCWVRFSFRYYSALWPRRTTPGQQCVSHACHVTSAPDCGGKTHLPAFDWWQEDQSEELHGVMWGLRYQWSPRPICFKRRKKKKREKKSETRRFLPSLLLLFFYFFYFLCIFESIPRLSWRGWKLAGLASSTVVERVGVRQKVGVRMSSWCLNPQKPRTDIVNLKLWAQEPNE